MTARTAAKPSRTWKILLSLMLAITLVCLLGAAGVLVLFSYTQASTAAGASPSQPTSSGIPISGLPSSTPLRLGMSSAAPTHTPFQPVTNTPTPTVTPTATATATFTPTATATSTPTPTRTHTPLPTATPIPPSETPSDGLPAEAYISGVSGHPQALPLSCEARSAVDWAAYYGVTIAEMEFQYSLPLSDNPNTGFVGDPRAERGQVPPNPYGVHAAPVAALLRGYGLSAHSQTGYSWQDLRRQVANGQPVIAWVIGNVWTGYSGMRYTAADGETLTVVPYEHTVIVIGYSPDSVTVVDNDLLYTASLDRFLASWSVLGNMVVTAE